VCQAAHISGEERRHTGDARCPASKEAAGIELRREGNGDIYVDPKLFHTFWLGEDLDRIINWKETLTAIRSIENMLKDEENYPGKIWIAEDNTTAVAALNKMYYPGDPFLCGLLLQLFEKLGRGCIHAEYVNTVIQAADEPSRGKERPRSANFVSRSY
jgi:hypothetical protein